MRSIWMGWAVAAAMWGSCVASANESVASPLQPYFGNTWVYTGDEDTKYVYLDADGAFAIVLQTGPLFRGHWTLEGAKVCFHVPDDQPSCFTDLLGRTVGVAWAGERPKGRYTGIIHAGRPNFIRQGTN